MRAFQRDELFAAFSRTSNLIVRFFLSRRIFIEKFSSDIVIRPVGSSRSSTPRSSRPDNQRNGLFPRVILRISRQNLGNFSNPICPGHGVLSYYCTCIFIFGFFPRCVSRGGLMSVLARYESWSSAWGRFYPLIVVASFSGSLFFENDHRYSRSLSLSERFDFVTCAVISNFAGFRFRRNGTAVFPIRFRLIVCAVYRRYIWNVWVCSCAHALTISRNCITTVCELSSMLIFNLTYVLTN